MRFIAREKFEFTNNAIGWRPGGPMDCLGPYAKVQNCPICYLKDGERVEVVRRTAYATGYADTYFSIPAQTKFKGKHLGGFFTPDSNGGIVFIVYDRFLNRLIGENK